VKAGSRAAIHEIAAFLAGSLRSSRILRAPIETICSFRSVSFGGVDAAGSAGKTAEMVRKSASTPGLIGSLVSTHGVMSERRRDDGPRNERPPPGVMLSA
jgi:hypothetical protein